MAYKALYRTYRPDNFEEMAGQKHIVKTLENAIKQEQIAHAYLFCGPRGTGKTSSAKIFAKAINCTSSEGKPCGVCDNCIAAQNGTHPDIIEIDAASNNGVEEARNLIEKVKYAPSQGKYKVYIIDEVHMMSTGAFNALLKTIEEPPAHIIFILATTEPYKVIPTIISRCQRFDFSKITKNEIVKRLKYVVTQESIEVEDKALESISILSDGGMRDALSILDQCRAYAPTKITLQDVNDIYGVVSTQEVCDILECVKYNEVAKLMNVIETLDKAGTDIKRLTTDLIEVVKESVVYDYSKDESLMDLLTLEQVRVLKENTTTANRLDMIDILINTYEKYRQASNVISYFEIGLLKMIDLFFKGIQREETKKHEEINHIYEKKELVPSSVQEDVSIELEEELIETIEEVALAMPVIDPISESTHSDIVNLEENKIIEEVVKFESESNDSEVVNLEENNKMQEAVHSQTIQTDIQEDTIFNDKVSDVEIKQEHEKKEYEGLKNEYIVRLLVGANKPEKVSDVERMQNLDDYALEMHYAKYANLLKNCNIVASAEQYIILCVESNAKANEINDLDKNSEFLLFTQELLNKKKKVFAITPDQRDEVISDFVRRNKEKNLPEAVNFDFSESNEEKEEDQISIMKSMFSNIEIKED